MTGLSTTVSAEVLSAVVTALVNVNNAVVTAAGNPDELSKLSSAVAAITSQLAEVVADPSKLQAFKASAVPPPPPSYALASHPRLTSPPPSREPC